MNRMLRLLQASVILIVALAGAALAMPAAANAQSKTPDLSATVTSNDPFKPSVRLKNVSGQACQVATTSQGTIAITKVVQNGKTLQPVAADGAFSEDVGYLLQS